ncbi:hypothetical protein [Arsukibacterium sp.]|uniref:hypothetical protein n=1 Tax=Arsukibacterium sp. TaxID=1977258 RepID=UPI00299D0B76|nr:hypothetical protein [Arsukibacterium sp.]MDX1678262.1 hypothetical protein [Arsukibacterium sp.]
MATPENTIELASDYATWLAEARLALSEHQNIVSFIFNADNSTVTFDTISFNTARILPEVHLKPE